MAGSVDHIVESLNWFNIKYDQGPYLQSTRLDLYKKYANILIEKGLAYPDPYNEEDLEVWRKESEENKNLSCIGIIDPRILKFGTELNLCVLKCLRLRDTNGKT